MRIIVMQDPSELGKRGRPNGCANRLEIQSKIRGEANLILATGTSQFETLNQLTKEEIDWSKVIMFHLDEFIGLSESSPASFRRYLKETVHSKSSSIERNSFCKWGRENRLKNVCG